MRKVERVTISAEGRDDRKCFVVKEMPAMQAEKWALRYLLALARAGADVGQIKDSGMAGLALASLEAMPNLHFEDLEPLMDEMMGCVSVAPDPVRSPEFTRALIHGTEGGDGDDVQEIDTLMKLRSKIMEMHLSFFERGARSNSTSETTPTPPNSSATPTFRDR